jgi:glycosyltransferase involved in cell wall biosynthesis
MKKISVIIPAYNAEKLIRKAAESALQFEEVGEVILVEDGSPDSTLDVCKQLEKEYEKVKLFRHPGGENKGAGASRNLGIQKSSYEYVAFIDADDYFLPNRFDAERKLLFDDDKIDGVYGAIGTVYSSDEAKEIFRESAQPELLTVRQNIPPEKLKYTLLGMSSDYQGSAFFSLDALTVKKSLIEKAGYMNEKLRLHQDTDIIIKMSFLGKLVPGIIDKPVGMRTIHGSNRITSGSYGFQSRSLQFSELEKWLNENIPGEEKIKRFARKEKIISRELSSDNPKKLNRLNYLFRTEPYLFWLEREFERLVKGMFGDNFLIKVINKLKVYMIRLFFSSQVNYWRELFYN